MELENSLKSIVNRDVDEDDVWVYPDDVMVEIISRLPDKPLYRFKCLSKNWCQLISDVCIPRMTWLLPRRRRPVAGLYFRAVHIAPRERPFLARVPTFDMSYWFAGDWIPKKPDGEIPYSAYYASLNEEEDGGGGGRLIGWEESTTSFALPFTPNPDYLLDSCNGLLLFFDPDSFRYYVCNPFTRQSVPVALPDYWFPVPEKYPEGESFYAALVFDPSKSRSYKIVRFHMCFPPWVELPGAAGPWCYRMFLEIYDSVNRSWSKHPVDIDTSVLKDLWIRHSTYFDGSLFRLAYSWYLVRFDLEEIGVSLIKLPVVRGLCGGLIGCIGVLMGELCYANQYGDLILIWSLSSCTNTGDWVCKYRVNFYDLTHNLSIFREGGCPLIEEWIEPICFDPDSNVVYLGSPLVILSFNLDSNKLEEIVRMENDDVIVPGCYFPSFCYSRLHTNLETLQK